MAPTLVQSSLIRFAHDDADMVRRVDTKAYERLAKEENDFAKDAELTCHPATNRGGRYGGQPDAPGPLTS